jgi:L-lactate dehydrogenase complex protein LldG
MSDSRDQILRNIRAALGRTAELPAATQKKLRDRIAQASAGPLPALSVDLLEIFISKLAAVSGTCVVVTTPEQVIEEIDTHLARHQLAPRLVASTEPLIAALPWPAQWTVAYRVAQGVDLVSVTGAFAAVAETGTLALVSGPTSPTTLRFLPDDHIVVIQRSQVVAHIEDVWKKLRAQYESPPRSINLITGPSRTADVEQTIQLGAHGPRRLHVIVLTNK